MNKNYLQKYIRFILTSALAAFLGFVVAKRVQVKRALVPTFDINNYVPPAQLSLDTPSTYTSFDSALLVDSLISILQSYYVDPGRADTASLLNLSVAYLKSNKTIDVVEKFGGRYATTKLGEIKIPESREITYEQLVKFVDRLGTIVVEKNKKEVSRDVVVKHGLSPGHRLVVNSILMSLDAHSALLSEKTYRELKQGTEGRFGGLGILVGIREKLLTIIKPLPRSPAEKVGIQAKDKILSIDGHSTFGKTLDELVELMRGNPGTPVGLDLIREGKSRVLKVKLNREIINVDSVATRRIGPPKGKLLHLTIENFASRTSAEVQLAVLKFLAEYDEPGGVILDLRSNPGGLLDQAVQVADIFLDKGPIVSTLGRHKEIENATKGYDILDLPVVVLIDRNSASASEIVAGALQDHGRALIVGQPSFGKGSVQTIFELPGEQALKLTIARYYTPSGRSIQNTGIMPDVWMQPVSTRQANSNLLGYQRYDGESFLAHSLQVNHNKKLQMRYQPLFKSYYLTDVGDDAELEDRSGHELEIAEKMLLRAFRSGSRISSRSLSTVDFLHETNKDFLTKQLSMWGDKVSDVLEERHQIVWKGFSKRADLIETSQVGIKVKDIPQRAYPGEAVEILLHVSNDHKFPLENASVFFHSDQFNIPTNEMLIGTIEAESSRFVKLKVEIPNQMPEGVALGKIGLVKKASNRPIAQAAISFMVQRREAVDLSVRTEMRDGGKNLNSLESNEAAEIVVTIVNNSNIEAKNFDVGFYNFSGEQVSVFKGKETVRELPAHAEKKISFKVQGGKLLFDELLRFGVAVDSPYLRGELHKEFTIDATRSMNINPQKPMIMSH